MSAENFKPYTEQFEFSFDDKGRITVPAEWRAEGYESKLIALPGTDKSSGKPCVKMYPMSWLNVKITEVAKLPSQNPHRREFERLASEVQQIAWDEQGRINVRENLRKRANLKGKTALVGRFYHFELWNPKDIAPAENAPVRGVEDVLESLGI
jgi:MraZ protein